MTTGPGMETLRDARRKLEPGGTLVPEVIPAGPGPDVLHSRLALTDPEVLKGQLAAYSAARKLFVDWLFSNLTAGVDYMLNSVRVGVATVAEHDVSRCHRKAPPFRWRSCRSSSPGRRSFPPHPGRCKRSRNSRFRP